jgi:quercetin dioxygenase-like cupin family protein
MHDHRNNASEQQPSAQPGRRELLMTGSILAVMAVAKLTGGPAEASQPAATSGSEVAQAVTKKETQTMEIRRVGAQPSRVAPAEYFTGTVRLDPLFPAVDPSRVNAGSVTFEPGARSAWHTHPLGQTLIITAGCGWVQREGGPIEEVRAGDVVSFPPGLKHWHGATPTTAMTHIAIQEAVNGKNVDWLEKVSDAQYRR